jgi:hypothetical protein
MFNKIFDDFKTISSLQNFDYVNLEIEPARLPKEKKSIWRRAYDALVDLPSSIIARFSKKLHDRVILYKKPTNIEAIAADITFLKSSPRIYQYRLVRITLKIIDFVYRIRPYHTPLPLVFKTLATRVSANMPDLSSANFNQVDAFKQKLKRFQSDVKLLQSGYLQRTQRIWKRVLAYFVPAYRSYLNRIRTEDFNQLTSAIDKITAAVDNRLDTIRKETLAKHQAELARKEAEEKQRQRKFAKEKQQAEMMVAFEEAPRIVQQLTEAPPVHPIDAPTMPVTIVEERIVVTQALKEHTGFISIKASDLFKKEFANGLVNFKILDGFIEHKVIPFKGLVIEFSEQDYLSNSDLRYLNSLIYQKNLPKIVLNHLKQVYLGYHQDKWNMDAFMGMLNKVVSATPVHFKAFDLAELSNEQLSKVLKAFPYLATNGTDGTADFAFIRPRMILKLLPHYHQQIKSIRFSQCFRITDQFLQLFAKLPFVQSIETINLCAHYKFSVEPKTGSADWDENRYKQVYSLDTFKALNAMPHVKRVMVAGKKHYSDEAVAQIAMLCPKVIWFDDCEETFQEVVDGIKAFDFSGYYMNPTSPSAIKKYLHNLGRNLAVLKQNFPMEEILRVVAATNVSAAGCEWMQTHLEAVCHALTTGRKLKELNHNNPYMERLSRLLHEDATDILSISNLRESNARFFMEGGYYRATLAELPDILTLLHSKNKFVQAIEVDLNHQPLDRKTVCYLVNLLSTREYPHEPRTCYPAYYVPVVVLKNLGSNKVLRTCFNTVEEYNTFNKLLNRLESAHEISCEHPMLTEKL